MSTDEQARALGLRWLAAGGGWQEGVLGRYRGAAILDGGAPRSIRWSSGATIAAYLVEWGAWPDPRDPATLGCWAARVREVVDPLAHAVCHDDEGAGWDHAWSIWSHAYEAWFGFGSEHQGEAWVAALEAHHANE